MAATIKIVIEGRNEASATLRDATRDIERLSDAARSSGNGFDALREIAVGALRAIGAAALDAAVEGARAMADFARDSINAASNFEGAINNLASVTSGAMDAAGVSMDDVRRKALQLGQDTAFSAMEAVQAMTALAKGGVSITDVMGGATDATLALAAAAGVDLVSAAEIVAKQLGVWGSTGVSAAQVTDLLAATANASTVDVQELALGLANAGGTAKVAGVSFQDLVQTMGLIAPGFSSAADAGTSLKTFISRLVPQTKEQTRAMIALGLATKDGSSKFFDAQGNFIGMANAAQLLHEALAPLPKDQQLVALNTIFGSDAIRAAALIAEAGAEGFTAFGRAMQETGGAAAAAATMQQGYNFQMEQFSGSIETLQITVGSLLLPALTSLMTNLTEGVNVVTSFVAQFKTIDEAAQFVLTSISAAAPGIGAALLAWTEQFGAWIVAALPQMSANLASLLQSLLTWIGAQAPGLVAALSVWGQKFADWIVVAIPIFLRSAAQFIASMLQWIAMNAPAILAQLATWTAQFVQWVALTSARLILALGTLFGELLQWIVANAPAILAQLTAWAQAFANWVPQAWTQLQATLSALWSQFAGWINETAGRLRADGSIGRALMDGIRAGIDAGVGAIIAAAQSAVSSALSAAIRAAQEALARLPFGGGGGGGGGGGTGARGGGRASGGAALAGTPLIVGEHGRELFIPATSGRIVPASQVSNTYHFNYAPVYSSVPASPAADFALMQALARV